MQISNADGGEVPKAEKIETATHVGAVVTDRIVLFGKAADCAKTGEDIRLEIPRGKTYKVMIADCKEGTWTIYDAISGKEVMHISANAEGRVLNFEALGGSYNIVYTSGDITKPIPNPDARNYAKRGIEEYFISYALTALKEPISIYTPIYNDGGDTIYLSDQIATKEPLYDKETLLSLKKALSKLKSREKQVIYSRYIVGKTQTELSEELHISQAQVSRIESNALKNLKRLVK